MAGLGPKPRMSMGGGGGGVTAPGGGGGGGGLAFFDGPTGQMQPGVGFNQPPAQPSVPVSQPFGSANGGGGALQAPGGSMGSMGGSVGGNMGGSVSGSMGGGGGFASGGGGVGGMSMSSFFGGGAGATPSYDDDIENEPPILEELGINVEHIVMRMKGVAFFKKVEQEILEDLDLSGPLAIIMALSTCLLFAGKITFSYVYGFGVSGCVLIWMLINLMSQKGGIDMYRTASVLGYGLIPVVIMAALGVFVSLQSTFGSVIAAGCICWSTATASRFFATANAMDQQRWLVAYPVGLFYTCFSLLTVF